MALGVDKEIFEYIRDPEIFTPPATLDASIYQGASLASHFVIILSQPDAPIPPAVIPHPLDDDHGHDGPNEHVVKIIMASYDANYRYCALLRLDGFNEYIYDGSDAPTDDEVY